MKLWKLRKQNANDFNENAKILYQTYPIIKVHPLCYYTASYDFTIENEQIGEKGSLLRTLSGS